MSTEETPKKFWKYFNLDEKSWSTTLSAIAGRYFWLADPSSFSDAIDNPWSYSKNSKEPIFFYHNKIIEREIHETYRQIKTRRDQETGLNVPYHEQNKDLYDPLVERFLSMYENRYKPKIAQDHWLWDLQSIGDDETGVFSFSSSCKNQYLWDKYASGHRGFCLGFELIEGSPHPIEVKYKSDQPLCFNLNQVLKSPKILWDTLSIKDKKFEAEKEWRIIKSTEYRVGHDKDNEWTNPRKFRDFRLTECLLGTLFPTNLVDIITAVLPPHVVLGKAEFHPFAKNKEMSFTGFGAGPPKKGYMAGRDRRIIEKLCSDQTGDINPEMYENHGRDEGFSQIRLNRKVLQTFPKRKRINST